MAQSNDIVINAAANTKSAEASIKQLDAQIKNLAASNPKLKQIDGSLSSIGRKVLESNQAMGTGFAALQGSFNGVITKLGAVGLAVGGLKLAWDTMQKENQRSLDNIKESASAAEKYYTTVNDQTQDILSKLEKLNKLADGGYLDDTAIKQTNSLVAQLNDLWGDVGISVDKATGKVSGLQAATQKINSELREMQLQQLKLEEEVAKNELASAELRRDWWYDENGNLHNEAQGLLIAGNWTGNGDTFKAEVMNDVKTKQANLLGIQARIKALNTTTTQNDIDSTLAAAEARKAAEEAAKAQSAKVQQQLAAAQGVLGEKPDWKLLNLQSELAIAQATGGDVAGAKAAVDAYTRERDTARFNELEGRIRAGVKTYNERLAAYNKGVADNVDAGTLLNLTNALNEITDSLKRDAEEFNRLGAKLEQPETPIEEPETEVAAIMQSIANGTFDSYGLNGLAQNPIEQQQLEVQKQIARNTENLNVPIVGE